MYVWTIGIQHFHLSWTSPLQVVEVDSSDKEEMCSLARAMPKSPGPKGRGDTPGDPRAPRCGPRGPGFPGEYPLKSISKRFTNPGLTWFLNVFKDNRNDEDPIALRANFAG